MSPPKYFCGHETQWLMSAFEESLPMGLLVSTYPLKTAQSKNERRYDRRNERHFNIIENVPEICSTNPYCN